MEWLDKYIKKVRENRFNAVKVSVIVGIIMFVIFFVYNKLSGQTIQDSAIISSVLGAVFMIVWFIFSLDIVRRENNKEKKEALEKAKEIEKRRAKLAQGKVNKKKRK